MKKLLFMAAMVLFAACTKTGVQVKNESGLTIHSVVVYYYDEQGNLLNSYPVADSLVDGQTSSLIQIENASSYAKLTGCALPRTTVDSLMNEKEKFLKQYKDSPILPFVEFEMEKVTYYTRDYVFQNKYYIKNDDITNIVINETSKID